MKKLTDGELAMHNLLDDHNYVLTWDGKGTEEACCTICGQRAPQHIFDALVMEHTAQHITSYAYADTADVAAEARARYEADNAWEEKKVNLNNI